MKVIFGFLPLLLLWAHAAPAFDLDDFTYSARLSADGDFRLKIDFSIPTSSFPAFIDNLHREEVLKKTEKLLLKHQTTYEPQKNAFTLRTRVSKTHLRADFESYCTYTATPSSYVENCTLLTDRADGARFFKTASTSISCQANKESTRCRRSMTGEVREINFFVISRSARQLAVSGMIESIESAYAYQLYIEDPSAVPAKTATHRRIIAPFWKQSTLLAQSLTSEQFLNVIGDSKGIQYQITE